MYTFLLILLILISLVLIGAILMQSGKGGGLAASFGGASSSSNAFLGTRQAGNILTKLSWWGGGIFLGLAFILQLLSLRSRVPSSVLDQTVAPQAAPTVPVGPAPVSPLDPQGSAVPATPVPPQ